MPGDLAPVERNGSEPARTSIGPLAHGADRSLDVWPVRLRDAIFKPGWWLLEFAQGQRGLDLDFQQARLLARPPAKAHFFPGKQTKITQTP